MVVGWWRERSDQGVDGGLVGCQVARGLCPRPAGRPAMAGLGRLLASRRRTRRLTATVAVLSVLALGGPLLAAHSMAASAGPVYRDPRAPVAARVKDLLGR